MVTVIDFNQVLLTALLMLLVKKLVDGQMMLLLSFNGDESPGELLPRVPDQVVTILPELVCFIFHLQSPTKSMTHTFNSTSC